MIYCLNFHKRSLGQEGVGGIQKMPKKINLPPYTLKALYIEK